MPMGLIGNKCGMTRIFTEDGVSVPVTVVEIQKHYVTQIKTTDSDGYCAIQISTGKPPRTDKIHKAIKGHYQKAGVEPGQGLWEFRIPAAQISAYQIGAVLDATLFKIGDIVDVAGKTKGRGFSGVIRRHNFSSQRASHGNSLSHNAPGSIGQNQSPGRVFKGKKMAGQYGNTNVTIQNLEVVKVDTELNVLLIRGAIPGAPGRSVVITPATKHPSVTEAA